MQLSSQRADPTPDRAAGIGQKIAGQRAGAANTRQHSSRSDLVLQAPGGGEHVGQCGDRSVIDAARMISDRRHSFLVLWINRNFPQEASQLGEWVRKGDCQTHIVILKRPSTVGWEGRCRVAGGGWPLRCGTPVSGRGDRS